MLSLSMQLPLTKILITLVLDRKVGSVAKMLGRWQRIELRITRVQLWGADKGLV